MLLNIQKKARSNTFEAPRKEYSVQVRNTTWSTYGEYQVEKKRQVFDASHPAGHHFYTHLFTDFEENDQSRKMTNINVSKQYESCARLL